MKKKPRTKDPTVAPAAPTDTLLSPATLGLLFLASLAVRLAHLYFMSDSPYFTRPIVDAETYVNQARAIAAGFGHPDSVYWQAPGYAYFLALVFRIFDFGLWAPRAVQSVLGAGTVVLTAQIGAHVFGKRVGLIAGLLTACYGMLVYFDAELLTPSLTIFLQLAAIRLVIARTAVRPWQWLTAGLLAGLASIVTATSLLLVALLAVFARKHAAWAILGAVLAIAPVAVRNYVKGEKLVLVSYNGGLNLYIGNNPNYDQTVAIRPGRNWDKLVTEPVRSETSGYAGRSGFFIGKVLDYAVNQPFDFLLLQLRKLYLYAGGDEIYRNHAIYPARHESPVLALLLWKVPGLAFPWGLVFPLAVVGLLIGWRSSPLLTAWVVVSMVSVVAFFVASRYRLPIVPILIVFGVGGVSRFVNASRRSKTVAVLAGLGVFLASNLAQGEMDPEMNSDAQYKLGVYLKREGQLREAEALFVTALKKTPEMPEVWQDLGDLLLEQGRRPEALWSYGQGAAIAPDDVDLLVKHGKLLADAGNPQEAISQYLRALAVAPDAGWINAYVKAAQDQLAGKAPTSTQPLLPPTEEELNQWRQALFTTGDTVWLSKLVTGYERRGRLKDAIDVLEIVIERSPDDPALHFTLGRLHIKNRNLVTGLGFVKHARKLSPDAVDQWIRETPELKHVPQEALTEK